MPIPNWYIQGQGITTQFCTYCRHEGESVNVYQCPKCPDNSSTTWSELARHYGIEHGIIKMFLKQLDFEDVFGQEPTTEVIGYYELELIKGI